jgi:NADH-quinone oxidoreductase subunit L
MVAAGVYLSARMFPIFTPDALGFIAWTGGITAALGSIIAVTQTDIKKVLAYSTISQLGYMILGVGVGAPWAAMFHLCTHAMFKACLFLGSGSVIHAMHHAQDLKDMGGLRRKMPVTFWTFVFSTLALAGVPLTSGFLSKDAILLQALHHHRYVLFALGFATAFLTAFYMTRLVWLCFMGQPRNEEKFAHAHESPLVMVAPLVILALFTPWVIWGGFETDFFGTPAYLASYPDAEHVQAAYIAPGGHPPHHDHPLFFQVLAYATGFAGIALGVIAFRSGQRDEKSRLLPGPLHDLSAHKFYLDEMYLDGVVAAGNALSDRSAFVDANVVDGAVNVSGALSLLVSDASGDADQVIVDGAVNLTADTAEGAGAMVATAQTGRIRNYLAAAMGLTAVVVVLIVFVL